VRELTGAYAQLQVDGNSIGVPRSGKATPGAFMLQPLDYGTEGSGVLSSSCDHPENDDTYSVIAPAGLQCRDCSASVRLLLHQMRWQPKQPT
jgi:hypothetical protein